MKRVTLTNAIRGGDYDSEGWIARLEGQGFLRRASASLPREILMAKPPRPSGGASALEAFLGERRDGR